MSKKYSLEIENIGSDTYTLMSRGHHDITLFMSKVREEQYDWPLGMPEHIWFKAVPLNNGEVRFHEVNKSVRGSFPATYVSEAYGDDGYEELIKRKASD